MSFLTIYYTSNLHKSNPFSVFLWFLFCTRFVFCCWKLNSCSGGSLHDNHSGRLYREDSSGSDDGDTVTFIVGSELSLAKNAMTSNQTSTTNTASSSSCVVSSSNVVHNLNHQPLTMSGTVAPERFVILLFFFFILI